jgi:tetratricopeptide (TPR) repeat protein
VLYCLASDPSLFQAYFALSPSLDWDHNLPQRSLEEALASTETLKAFLYVAHSDDFGRALADFNRLVHTLETTAPRGFRWAVGNFPEELHTSVTLLAQIDALRRLFSGYRFPGDLIDLGLGNVEEHFNVVSKVVGYPIPVPEDVMNDLGYAALASGRTDEAIALFGRNVEANPNSANAWDSLADGLAEAGRWKDATEAADRAVNLAVKFGNPQRAAFAEHANALHERR